MVHSTRFGWLVRASDRLIALDHSGELLGTFLVGASSNEENENGEQGNPNAAQNPLATGRWILADGSTLEGDSLSQLQLMYRRDQKVVVESLDAYLANPDNPRLPKVETLPFLVE